MQRRSIAIVSFFFLAAALGYFIARFQAKGPLSAAVAVPAQASPVPPIPEERAASASKLRDARRVLRNLPSDIVPLSDAFAELSREAQAGNAEAATRLYRDLSRCSSLPSTESAVASLSEQILRRAVDVMDSTQLETYQAELDSIEINRENLRRLHHMCDGVTNGMYDSRFWAVQRAAELGDSDARACVLQQGPGLDMRSLASKPQLLEQYRASIPALIRAGLAAGDWRVVEILNGAYAPDSNTLLGGMLDADPMQRYQFLQLYRLGYHLKYDQYSSEQVEAKAAAASSSLTAAQLAEADAWARDTYQNQFRNTDVSEATMTWGNACAF